MKRKSFTNYQKAGKKKQSDMKDQSKSVSYNPRKSFMLRPEVKYFDTVGSASISATADWTGTEVVCSSYIQDDGVTVGAYTDSALIPSANGPGYGEVLGGKYRINKIRVRGSILCTTDSDQADVKTGATSRLVLVMDTSAAGSQLQGEQVFTDLGSVEGCVLSFQQQGQSSDKYKVLKDEMMIHQVTATGTDGTSTMSVGFERKPFNFTYVPKEPLIVSCLTSGSTPSVSQLKDINIFLLCRATETGVINFAARCYYSDS